MEMCTGPWKQHLNVITNSGHHPPIFSDFFFHVLLLFFIQHSHTFHIWKCALDPEDITQTSSPTSPYFFLIFFFPYFTALFLLSMATPSLFGNAHWTLKKQCPTSSPTVSTIPYFFLSIFPYFIAIFHLEKRLFPYLEVRTGPWKQCPTSSPTVSTTIELTVTHNSLPQAYRWHCREISQPTLVRLFSLGVQLGI